jgi:hypothetical protein
MITEISARSLAVLPELSNRRWQGPPQIAQHCSNDDPAPWLMFPPNLARESKQRKNRENEPNDAKYETREEFDTDSTRQRRSTLCGINQALILADILARGIRVHAEHAAHPGKIAEQMVMALQAHHSELDQKLADAWKRQAAHDERTGF